MPASLQAYILGVLGTWCTWCPLAGSAKANPDQRHSGEKAF